ncbi:hypothetical protein [Moheibacter sediminis]|uniref:DUF2116 family Zn-ribbon domain-containing protein n=1 Tax=Moheibacter sediminis TaxID=1434700 RepID=A0A1W1Z4W3_9FLAO|nr:hypothetical protein [Moheibacter sediminis]SMC43396.1 hypothetical protein SAMN06296427_102204 [Moheibacter sediminis]
MQTCLECGDKIIGRADKKFCNDGCRNTYNNKQNKDSSNRMRNVNNRLRKNHRILSELKFKDNKTQTTNEVLESKGFDFNFFTNFKVYKNGAEYRFIYNIGYKFIEENRLLVVKND